MAIIYYEWSFFRLVVVRDAKETREEKRLREILGTRRAQDGLSENGTFRTLWPL